MLWPYGSGEPAPHETKQIICGINRDAGTPRLCEAAIENWFGGESNDM